jgi:hypothetical protein
LERKPASSPSLSAAEVAIATTATTGAERTTQAKGSDVRRTRSLVRATEYAKLLLAARRLAPEGRVEVGAIDRGTFVECYVRDNGIGIDPA